MSIHDKAVLVLLNVRLWSARRYDDKASETVAEHHHSKKDMGRYNKCLIDVKDEVFVRPTRIANQMRALHYKLTLPWLHKGTDMLPTAVFMKYKSEMDDLGNQLSDAVDDLCKAYPGLKARAKRDLNGLYNEADYPGVDELRSKFGYDARFMPVPHADDLRVNLSQKEVNKIKAQITEQIENATAEAMRDLWSRLHEVASKMAAALGDPERRFHDTLVGNVRELVSVLPLLNVTGDPDLAHMAEEVKKKLTKHDAETLREDEVIRANTAKKAAELAAKMLSLVPEIKK